MIEKAKKEKELKIQLEILTQKRDEYIQNRLRVDKLDMREEYRKEQIRK